MTVPVITHPEAAGDIHRAFVRRFPYHVIYRIHRDRVNVLAVCHSHADPRAVLARASRREATH
jgi:plasmid stabilization system protein ParE